MKWTDKQLDVINTRNRNILVSAAAGSGKTAGLVERIINMITDEESDVNIDELLVVTFTRAAASEMKERVRAALEEAIEKNPDNENIIKLISLIHNADISTIDSFCAKIVRENFDKIDLDPNFRIGDETECSLMKLEAIDETFDILYEQNDEEFCYLVDCYAEKRGDSNLQNLILSIYSFVMASPYPKEWLIQSAEDFNIDENFDFATSKWAKAKHATVKIQVQGVKASMA